MLFTDVQRYLAAHRRTTLGQLTLHFGVAPPALQGMLDLLVRKGKVRRLPEPQVRCRGCGLCGSALLEAYEWIGDRSQTAGNAGAGATTEQLPETG